MTSHSDRRGFLAGLMTAGGLGWAGAASGQTSAYMRERAARDRARRAAARTRIEIPFRIDQNTPWTVVQFTGGEPEPFMLDINAGIVQAHPSVIEPLGLTARRRLGDVAEYDPADLTIAGVPAPGLLLMTNARLFEGRVATGSAPLMAFQLPFELNWDERMLTFASLDGADMDGWTTMSGRALRWQWPTIEAELDGEPVRLAVETEIASGVTLFPEYFDRRGLWDRYERRRTDLTPTGEPFAQMVVADRLAFGNLALDRPLVRLKRGWDVFEAQHGIRVPGGPDGVIGVDVLKRFNLRCDAQADAFSMKPSRAFEAPYLDDRAGLVLTTREEHAVVSVIDTASPAYRAGLREGDAIVEHYAPGGLGSLAWAVLQPAGNSVELAYLREGWPEQRAVIVLEDRV